LAALESLDNLFLPYLLLTHLIFYNAQESLLIMKLLCHFSRRSYICHKQSKLPHLSLGPSNHQSQQQCRGYYMKYAEDFLKTSAYTLESSQPVSVDVLICGGGLVGASIAYHLAKRGGIRVILVEQGR